MKIRKATKNDIKSLVDLHTGLMEYHIELNKSIFRIPLKKEIKTFLHKDSKKRNRIILVAEDKSKLIGFFTARIEKAKHHLKFKKIGKIGAAFLLKDYRNKGIGNKVLKELIKWFKKHKIRHIELTVYSENKQGIKAWENKKFKEYMKVMKLDL